VGSGQLRSARTGWRDASACSVRHCSGLYPGATSGLDWTHAGAKDRV